MKKKKKELTHERKTEQKEKNENRPMTFTCHINFSHPEHTSKEHGNNVMAEYSGSEMQAAVCRYSSGSNSQRHLQGC